MLLDEVLDTIRAHAVELRALGAARLDVFGSVARGEADTQSDVDLLVELARPMGLFDFARLQQHLEAILGRKVDLVTRSALRPEMREEILRDATRAA